MRRAKDQQLKAELRAALKQMRTLRQNSASASSSSTLPAGPISLETAAMALKRYLLQGVVSAPATERVQAVRNVSRRWHEDKWQVNDKCSQHESGLGRRVFRLLTDDPAFRLGGQDPPLTAGSQVDDQGYGAKASPSGWKKWAKSP